MRPSVLHKGTALLGPRGCSASWEWGPGKEGTGTGPAVEEPGPGEPWWAGVGGARCHLNPVSLPPGLRVTSCGQGQRPSRAGEEMGGVQAGLGRGTAGRLRDVGGRPAWAQVPAGSQAVPCLPGPQDWSPEPAPRPSRRGPAPLPPDEWLLAQALTRPVCHERKPRCRRSGHL